MGVKLKKYKEAEKALKVLKKFFSDNAPGTRNALEELDKSLQSLEVEKEDSSSNDAFLLEKKLQDNFEIVAFSDGACRGNPGPGAWGSLILSSKNEVMYEGSGVELGTTNNRMELMGAIDCLKNLKGDLDKKNRSY